MAMIKKDIGAYSAYAIAVKHGYEGTEAEWTAAQEQARVDSQAAAKAAQAAQEAAETARKQAQTAKTGAETAQKAAGQAAQAAQEAARTATHAAQAAQTAKGAAEQAQTGAQEAKTEAETAKTEAHTAKTAAEEAAKQAQDAQTGAEAAQAKAEEAAQGVAADREQIGSNKSGLAETKATLATTQEALKKAQRAIQLQAELNKGQTWDFEEDTQEAYQRQVPSGAKAGAVMAVGGKTVVWNQLVPAHAVVTSSGNIPFAAGTSFVSGHKYLIGYTSDYTEEGIKTDVHLAGATTDGKPVDYGAVSSASAGHHSGIITMAANAVSDGTISGNGNIWIYVRNGNGMHDCTVIDLTLMFGSGNEPADTSDPRIAQIEAYAAAHPEYNAGELLSALVDEVRVKGKNLLNANIDGYAINIDTGLPNKDSRMSVTDFIPVVPMDTYGMFSNFGNLGKLNVACYDSAKFYTGKYPVTNLRGFKSFVVPTGTRYVRCCILTTEKKASYLIRGVSAGTAADYSPYKLETFQLPAAVRSLLGYGWSAGNVANTVERTENGWQYVQRVGSRAYQEGDELTDGTTTYYALATPITTDITALMGDSLAPFSAEAGGSITMHHPKADEGLAIDVPAKIQYITKLSEVSANG